MIEAQPASAWLACGPLDRSTPSGIDELRYEKYLLADWLQRELGARAGS